MFRNVLLSCFIFVVGNSASAFDHITFPADPFDITCTGQTYTTTIVRNSNINGQYVVEFQRDVGGGTWSSVATGGITLTANGTYNVTVNLPNLPTGTVYNTCRARIVQNGN